MNVETNLNVKTNERPMADSPCFFDFAVKSKKVELVYKKSPVLYTWLIEKTACSDESRFLPNEVNDVACV